MPHNKLRMYELLYEFGLTNEQVTSEVLAELLKHDLSTREKPKKWPAFIKREDKVREETRAFYQDEVMAKTVLASYKGYTSKQISRMAHLEQYNYDVLGDGHKKNLWLFYDYKKKNIMTGHASVTEVLL